VRQVWHIFKKDARRLKWEVAATLALLAWLAHLDRWRSDWTPGFAEGWLNVLLPFAWCYLAGLAILQDPVVGDREFWLTLPCRRRHMLGAKALFVLCFIHLPYFLAQAAILAFRGFSPVTYFQHLMWKQLVLLLALTLPAAALAVLVENVVQFALAAVLMAAGVIFLGGTNPMSVQPWIQTDYVRSGLALLSVTFGALAALVQQYARRRTAISRGIGAAAAIAAAVVFVWLPREASMVMQCALDPARLTRPLSVGLSGYAEALPQTLRRNYPASTYVDAALPIRISGLPQDAIAWFTQLSLEIQTADGEQHDAGFLSRSDPFRKIPLQASVWPGDHAPSYQVLTVTPDLYDRIKDGPVSIHGKIVVEFHRREAAARIPVGKRAEASGAGKCFSGVSAEIVLQRNELSVDCESPAEIPYLTEVTLLQPGTGREWRQRLGMASRVMGYPLKTWLSPLNRRNAFFPLTSEEDWVKGSYLVPQEALSTAVLEVVPEPLTGRAIVEYEWNSVRLSKYAVPR
jgi:hypothetical protein